MTLRRDTNSVYRRTRMYTGVEGRHFEKKSYKFSNYTLFN